MKNLKLLCIASNDSFVKASIPILQAYATKHFDIQSYIYTTPNKPITLEHIQELGFDFPFIKGSPEKIWDLIPDLMSFDAILLSVSGGDMYRFLKSFGEKYSKNQKRPVMIGGYCGLVYEGFLNGYLNRSPLDVLFVNSQHDHDLFMEFAKALRLNPENICLTGLPLLDVQTQKLTQITPNENRGLVFAGQVNVPFTKIERTYIVSKLIEYARTHPQERVYLKPRVRKHQKAYHHVTYHYEDLLRDVAKVTEVPDNFELTYEPLSSLFEKTNHCVTVSSTAIIEAHIRGLYTDLLFDFGIHAHYGNEYFQHSGALSTFDNILKGHKSQFDTQWVQRHILSDGNNAIRVVERTIEELKTTKSRWINPVESSFTIKQKSGYHAFTQWYFDRIVKKSIRGSLYVGVRWVYRKCKQLLRLFLPAEAKRIIYRTKNQKR